MLRRLARYLPRRVILAVGRSWLWCRSLQRRLTAAFSSFREGSESYRLELRCIDGFKVAYRGHTSDEDVLEQSFSNDRFLASVPEYEIAESDTVIDVGAHIGTFSLHVASFLPRGRVFAVEASRDTANFLRINVALNRLANVDVSHLALSDESGTAFLYLDTVGGNWGHSLTAQLSSRRERVTTVSLDDFLREKGIAYCDFMKMNCEGAEFPILLAASNDTLARFGVILVLYHDDLTKDASHEDLERHLRTAAFSTTIRNRSASRGWLVATNRFRRNQGPKL